LCILFIAILSIMAEYKDGRGNTSQGHGGMSFRSRGLSTRG